MNEIELPAEDTGTTIEEARAAEDRRFGFRRLTVGEDGTYRDDALIDFLKRTAQAHYSAAQLGIDRERALAKLESVTGVLDFLGVPFEGEIVSPVDILEATRETPADRGWKPSAIREAERMGAKVIRSGVVDTEGEKPVQ